MKTVIISDKLNGHLFAVKHQIGSTTGGFTAYKSKKARTKFFRKHFTKQGFCCIEFSNN